MVQSQSILRLLALALTSAGVGFASAPSDLPRISSEFASSGWAFADFDGDYKADVATATSGQRDSGGYPQELRVDLSESGHRSFKFHSRTATVELDSWDIDGDHDRDLVIMEPVSRRPVAVWLNDGWGEFHEGNLTDFASALEHRNSPHSFQTSRMREVVAALFETRVPTTALEFAEFVSIGFQSSRPLAEISRPVQGCCSKLRSRAPPQNS